MPSSLSTVLRSVFIERILINYLNAMWGHQVVDNIGREDAGDSPVWRAVVALLLGID